MPTLVCGPLLEIFQMPLSLTQIWNLTSKLFGSNLRESQNSIGESSEEKKMEARTFAELVTCIKSSIEKHYLLLIFY